MSKKIVLGFSGGLDTSFCVKYLTDELGYEVHSIIVNTGGFSDSELLEVEAHAYRLGVKSHTTVNAIKSYYDSIIKYLIFGNVLKNNTYPLSVSAERLSQALHIAERGRQAPPDRCRRPKRVLSPQNAVRLSRNGFWRCDRIQPPLP